MIMVWLMSHDYKLNPFDNSPETDRIVKKYGVKYGAFTTYDFRRCKTYSISRL